MLIYLAKLKGNIFEVTPFPIVDSKALLATEICQKSMKYDRALRQWQAIMNIMIICTIDTMIDIYE